MSKKYLVVVGACAMVASAIQANDVSGRTTFIPRAPFQSSMPEKLTMFRDRADARCDGNGSAFQIVGFGGRSTKSKDLAKYFMFCGKSELVVAGDNAFANPTLAADPNQRDVNALHFNIQSSADPDMQNFKSTIKFRPRQTFYGIGFGYKNYFGCERKWWGEVSFPVLHVENSMRLEEDVQTEITALNENVNTNMIDAFKGEKGFFNRNGNAQGDALNFGKIDGKRKKTGVADIEVKVGYDYLCEETYHFGGFAGIVIPTGNDIKGEYVFEAQVPRNHFGFMLGSSAGFEIWCGCDSTVRWEFDANSRYLLSSTQTRTFDVKNKPWSRYMLIFEDYADSNATSSIVSQAVNAFTKKVKVKPRFEYNMNTAFVYDRCQFRGELGYNFFSRQAECVSLKAPWVEGPAFADVDGPGAQRGMINRAIQIGENFGGAVQNVAGNADAYSRLLIKEGDLDLESAAHPCALSHTLYGSLGYHWDDCCYPMAVGLGGSYEFSGENTALNRWTIWGKFVISL